MNFRHQDIDIGGDSTREAIAVASASNAIPPLDDGVGTVDIPKRVRISVEGTAEVSFNITPLASTVTIIAGCHVNAENPVIVKTLGRGFIQHIGSVAAGFIRVCPLQE